jgi:hypothetical protein
MYSCTVCDAEADLVDGELQRGCSCDAPVAASMVCGLHGVGGVEAKPDVRAQAIALLKLVLEKLNGSR